MTVKCNLFKPTVKWYGEVIFETETKPWQLTNDKVLIECGKEYTNIENFFIHVECSILNFLIIPKQ